MKPLLLVLVMAIVLSPAVLPATALAVARSPEPFAETGPDFLAGEILIQLSPEAFASYSAALGSAGRMGLPQIDSALADLGSRRVEPALASVGDPAGFAAAGLDRILRVHFDAAVPADEAARRFGPLPGVVYAEPNRIARAQFTPNDTWYAQQWAHDNTGQAVRYGGGTVGTPDCDTDTNEAWDLQTGSSSVIVAIIDTGVDTGHPEFAGRVVAGYDYVNNDSNPADDNGHGTSCAGIALGAGHNAQGIAGVAWGVRLMPVKVLSASGSGSYTAVANGINFAANNGAKILSLSLGGGASSTLANAVNYAYGRGCAIFCAAGNSNRSSLDYPAAYSNTIAVGALSPCNQRKSTSSCDGETWWGSNYGSGLEFLAPGVRIHTTDIRGSGGFGSGDYITDFNGTSAATPHAAGIGALVWSQNPVLTNAQLSSVLTASCDDLGTSGYDAQTGYGRMNAFRAVQAAGGGGVPTPETIFSENFEVNTVPGSVWSATDANSLSGLDYWGDQSSGARVHGGSWSAYCADNSNVSGQRYDNNMNSDMTLINAIDLTGYTNVQLSFWTWITTHNSSDYLSFQSWNGSSWSEVQRWSGSSGWTNRVYTVSGTSLRFRFVFYSNGSTTREGAYLDDITVVGTPSGLAQPGSGPVRLVPVDTGLAATLAEEDDATLIARETDAAAPALIASPNPFTAGTSLRFVLGEAAEVSLGVFGVDGRQVAQVHAGRLGAGEHSFMWSQAEGSQLPSGVYFARLRIGDLTTHTRLLRLR